MFHFPGVLLRRSLGFAGLCCAVLLAGCGSGGFVPVGSPPTQPPVTPLGVAGISLSPSVLNFGTIPTGGPSAPQVITVTSTGTAPLMVTSTSASGDYFYTADDCPVSLAVGSSCKLTLVFGPYASGPRNGVAVVGSNAPGAAPSVTLTGTGGVTTDTVVPGSLNFGSVALGSSSVAQSVTITSTGVDLLLLSSLTLSGDFARVSTTCGAVVSPGTSCQVNVVFTPTSLAARTGTLSIGGNTAASPQVVSLSGTGTVAPGVAGVPVTAKVMAGTTPIAGASVQLYAAGASGPRAGASALLAKALTTDATGTVVLAGYTCPSALAPVYLLASGGLTGAPAGASGNTNTLLMTAVGPCGAIATGSSFVVNEASSVASIYALQQFYAAGGVLGASATNLTGVTNAFGTASQLIDPATGASPANLPATVTAPVARLNSLANLVNSCVAAASQCGALYSATSVNGAKASNTLDALFNLVRFPAANIAGVYAQSQLSAAYAPALASAPSDWTMFFTYQGAGLNSPTSIAVDSTGSVWVANYFYTASRFSPQGIPVFANGLNGLGLNNSYGLAIDVNDQAWFPNQQPYSPFGIGSVTVFSAQGYTQSGPYGFQQGGLNYPTSVAIDPNGTSWVVDYGNSHVTLLNSLGIPLSGDSGYTTSLFAFPVAVAVDANHFGWIANQSSNTVTKIAPDGSSFTNYTCCSGASGIALDQGNNVWVANFYGDSVSLISNTGQVLGNSSYTGNGSLNRPQGIALDGNGNVWVANYRQPYLTELAGVGSSSVGASLTPATGYGADAHLLEAYGLAIDASGNIWVSNLGSFPMGAPNYITKFIGLASPVKTPLSLLPKAP